MTLAGEDHQFGVFICAGGLFRRSQRYDGIRVALKDQNGLWESTHVVIGVQVAHIEKEFFAEPQPPELQNLRDIFRRGEPGTPVVRNAVGRKVEDHTGEHVGTLFCSQTGNEPALTAAKEEKFTGQNRFHSREMINDCKQLFFFGEDGHLCGVAAAFGTVGTAAEVERIGQKAISGKSLAFAAEIRIAAVVAVHEDHRGERSACRRGV